MGNQSTKRHVIPNRKNQQVVNNNAYYVKNDKQAQILPSESFLWSKQSKLQEQHPYEASLPSNISELSALLVKTTSVVDLSDTSTLSISSDEISSRSSSETLHPRQSLKVNKPLDVDDQQTCRSCGEGGGDKSTSNSDQSYLNIESIATPTGCNRIQPQQLTHILEENVRNGAQATKQPVKELKPRQKTVPTGTTFSRQPINNLKNARSLSRLSLTSRPQTKPLNHPVIEPKKVICRPVESQKQKSGQISFSSSISQPRTIVKPVRDQQHPTPKNIQQVENHNSHQMQCSRSSSLSRTPSLAYWKQQPNHSNSSNNANIIKNVSHSNSSVNFSFDSPILTKPSASKGRKISSNLRPIFINPKDSPQSHLRSWASKPKASKRSCFRSPAATQASKTDLRVNGTAKKTHGLRKISEAQYQKYNNLINDFRYQMHSRASKRVSSAPYSRSPSVESRVSLITDLRAKCYDDTDDETYSFPESTTHVRPPSSEVERGTVGASSGSAGKHDGSTWSTLNKPTTSSVRSSRSAFADSRYTSRRDSSQSYIVEIKGNIKEIRRRQPDRKAVYCHKFVVSDGTFVQKVLADSKDHRIETICRQSSCRIHVKRRWLRNSSSPSFYEIIVFAREIRNIEKCCSLFNIMFPSFNAEAGLGY